MFKKLDFRLDMPSSNRLLQRSTDGNICEVPGTLRSAHKSLGLLTTMVAVVPDSGISDLEFSLDRRSITHHPPRDLQA